MYMYLLTHNKTMSVTAVLDRPPTSTTLHSDCLPFHIEYTIRQQSSLEMRLQTLLN